MDNLSVNLSDYGLGSQNDGFGSSSQENVDALNKALEAGDITGRETANLTDASGAPLKVESLEKTLKHLTFKESDIQLWKKVPKKPAYNTVEEYNQLTSYGADRGGFNNEGELPEEEDSTYVRRAQLVKYLGVTKSVTHQMTLVNTMVGNVLERAVKDGTMWILRKLDRSLYFGNSLIIPQEFNGFLAQQQQSDAFNSLNAYMNSDNVVDLRGKRLGESHIEKASNTIVENFGLGNELYAPPTVLSNFVNNFYGNKFIQPNTEALTNGIMGQKVQAFESQFGRIGLNYDLFMKKLPAKTAASTASHVKSPATPAWDGVTPIAINAGDANSKFVAADAGNVRYAVTSLNRYGESALAIHAVNAAAVAGCSIDLKFGITNNSYAATGYRIYRTFAGNTTDFYPLFDISVSDLTNGYDGAGQGVVRDLNHFLPNCDQAMMLQFDNEVIEFAQLAPLMKMDLAILSPAYRFMILMYGTPFLYAPLKMVRFVNIGTSAS